MFDDFEEMHPCEMGECQGTAPFDDEPYCLEHSPDGSSYMIGYSYRRMHKIDKELIMGVIYHCRSCTASVPKGQKRCTKCEKKQNV